MEIRKSHIIGSIVAAAALFAGIAGAQTLDQSVTDALGKSGAVMSQVSDQKQMSVEAAQEPDMFAAQHGHPGGPGGHGGQGGHGGHEGPGGDRGHGGHESHDGGHGRGGWHGHDGHWGDHGHYYYGYGRGLWLGWLFWNNVGSCRGWYIGRRDSCYAEASAENGACLASGEAPEACNAAFQSNMASCNYQWDHVYLPYWGRCAW
jgi:hypothetical protein